MKVHYTIVYRLHGAARLGDANLNGPFLSLQKHGLSCFLADDPEPYFSHIDKASAIASELLNIFSPIDRPVDLNEAILSRINALKNNRARRDARGVHLVFMCEARASDLTFAARRDQHDFGICLNDFDKTPIQDHFHPVISKIVSGFMLAIPERYESRVEKIGSVIYIEDPIKEIPVYPFTFEVGSVRLSTSTVLTTELVETATRYVKSLLADDRLTRSIPLLVKSTDPKLQELERFIFGWSALEVFVNVAFKNKYQVIWLDRIRQRTPDAEHRVLERFVEAMSGKYRLNDKFGIISSVLSPDSTLEDSSVFNGIKKVRDTLFHDIEFNEDLTSPTEEAQRLLIKYLNLHVNAVDSYWANSV